MLITSIHYLGLGAVLFAIGLLGLLINRQHLIHLFMCIELLLISINTQFIALSHYFGVLSGQIMVFFILAITASETAVALAILVLLFRTRHTVALTELNQLKG
jgi:NADH-quinone oxidoreductase subunit K